MLLDSDRNRILHMLEAAREGMGFVQSRTRSDLLTDAQLRFAVVRALEIIGEAASRLDPEFRATHPEIPWQPIIGARNRLVHAYFDIDHDIVWATATQALPKLVPMLEVLLEAQNRS